ncbi:hypothetical protein O0I10_011324 [Lichtheimia ornata]|uniref:Major facilitator superfamily (MFS) profile domain-containing protein n=1 Tax=Lichtheimia ornata TaxID=688661 RepID=A0AAD7UUL7_9FUNG|nr:uncharacterized protein O0I10_011324 [Lichtheimia ornata]KAJ8653024.1 hypothetical protein O0I10_011324 [Lichtheimia ornata]
MTQLDNKIERDLLRKLDRRLVAWAALAYFSNVLLRNNMPHAFTNGMNTDLHLNSSAYNWANSMFFISYSIFQIPSNVVFSQVLPQWYLPCAVILSGLLSNLMALITHRHIMLLYVVRFCLGLAEAGCYPCIIFLIGSWYLQKELNIRTGMIVIASNLASGVNGLLGGAIASNLEDLWGIRGWQWLFIIQGMFAICIGISGFFCLPNYPHNTPWITPEERQIALRRKPMSVKSPLEEQESLLLVSAKTLKHLATTPYCYLLTAMFACIVMGDTIMHNLTIILNGRGYSSAHANFMSVGVFMFSIFPSLVLARTSDTLRHKGLHVFLVSCWSAMWYMFSALVDTQVILFGAAYSATLNAILMPITLNWASQIYACDHDMRAIILPVIVTFGNLIPYLIRPLTWEVTDAPDYVKGKWSCVAAGLGAALFCVIIALLLRLRILLPQDVRREQQPLLGSSSHARRKRRYPRYTTDYKSLNM